MSGVASPEMMGLITIAKEVMELVVANAAEWNPKLIVEYEDPDEGMIIIEYYGDIDGLAEVLPPLVRPGPITSIAATLDTWTWIGPREEYPFPARPKDLYESGHPLVKECMSIQLITADSAENVLLPYERDGASVTWLSEHVHHDIEVDGRLANAFRIVIDYSHRKRG